MASRSTPSQQAFTPLPAQNRTESALQSIKTYISTHGLTPGDPLPSENQLCQDLHISRSAVREAIGQLQALDIVRVQRGRGTFVGEMSLEPLIEILLLRSSLDPNSTDTLHEVVQIRRMLDIGFASTIVAALTGERHPELHDLVDNMERSAQEGHTFLDADIAFHQALYSYGPVLLSQLGTTLWNIHMRALKVSKVEIAELEDTAVAHRRMLEAAENGRLDAYVAAIDTHYQPLLNSLASSQGQ